MAGTLYIVATPIGNLEDITIRALRVLREVAVVAAEDTRRTGRLLRHYGIATPLLSLHAHNERARTARVLDRLGRGESVALVTDAGTPGVSDPGAGLVAGARAAGFRVEPVPGASAVTAVMSIAGLEGASFCFVGFPPTRAKDRKTWFANLAALSSVAVIWYEAPHRLHRTLRDLMCALGDCPIFIARELTKLHEEATWTTAREALDHPAPPRGEYTLLIPPRRGPGISMEQPDSPTPQPSDEELADLLGRVPMPAGLTRRQQARTLAQQLGLSTKRVYAALIRTKP